MLAGMRIERADDIAVLRLVGGKANAMTTAFLDRLIELFDELEASDARAAVVVGDGKAFSAGLALPALVGLTRAQLRPFMELFGRAMLRVFTCPLPVVAAVNGHAIAGGCVLALECDLRLMADGPGKIGLTETRLGIGLPAVVLEPLRLQLPPTSLLPIALEGLLFSAAEARALGLVHEVTEPDALEARAIFRARELGRLPSGGYAQVKAALRRPTVDAITRLTADEGERWLDSWFGAEAQARLVEQVERLSAK
jgi:enoyl-CoA hydratase